MCGVKQFVEIGSGAMVSAMTPLRRSVVCYPLHLVLAPCPLPAAPFLLSVVRCRLPSRAMLGAPPLCRDVLPFGLVGRDPNVLLGLNIVALRRARVTNAELRELQQLVAYVFGVGADAPSATHFLPVRACVRACVLVCAGVFVCVCVCHS
jgi:acyl-[acyl carrier protein]--UDP-N-acetylglucosamine O-acyltransferase